MRCFAIIAVFLAFLACEATGQAVILNELLNASDTNEWVELLVLQEGLDLRGWDIRDFTSVGNPQPPLTFSSDPLWSALPKGTLIVVGSTGATFMEDTDPSDKLLLIKGANPIYFSGTPFSLAGGSDAVQIRTAGDAHVAGVSWGSANAASLPAPKVHSTGSVSSGSAIAFLEDSLPELTVLAAWNYAAGSSTMGTGNSAANAAWVASLRLVADGSGSASVTPDTLTHGDVVDIHVTVVRDTAFMITDVRCILPHAFFWSRSPSSVIVEGVTAITSVIGDTIALGSISWTTDSASVTIQNVTAPDSTAYYPLVVQSRSETTFRTIAPTPRITLFGLPVSIADIKGNNAEGVPLRSGALVTVRGIVTVADEFGGPSYLQDNSGGIAVFGSTFSSAVQVGDEVVLSGTVDPYYGLTELSSPVLHMVASRGNAVVPIPVSCGDVSKDGTGGVEEYEGLLVRLNDVLVRDIAGNPLSTWAMSGSGTNHLLLDAADTLQVRVDNGVEYANTPAPQGPFDIVGVVGQFKSTLPFIGGYQLLPRFAADILATGPGFATTPYESNLTPTGFHIEWTTHAAGTSALRYGISALHELGVIAPDAGLRTSHDVPVQGLQPATVYHVQAFSTIGIDTSWSGDFLVSTSSPVQTSGAIHAYFNKSVNVSLDPGNPAAGDQNLVNRLIGRITAARRSIDAAFYSLSGTPGPGTDIAQALLAARGRGVKVRVICEQDNRNTSPLNSLVAGGVPLITDAFDPVTGGAGLMHNKFLVFDGRGGAPESVWVWTGSWNPTDPGTNLDYQNAIEIQDQALAGAYTLEFNEMWGSSGDTPQAASSRFGSRKTDNTPHRFLVGGRPVSLYFSPSDRTTSQILRVIGTADYSLNIALLTLTRSDIAAALLARNGAGVQVHGVMDNRDDTGSQYDVLTSQGIDIRLKQGSGLLHHKYGVFDAGHPQSTPTVITGSHNWTNAAENSNNENTLILEDNALAMQYVQEFATRYYQFGGTDTIQADIAEPDGTLPQAVALLPNYPNPFNPVTTLTFELPSAGSVRLTVFDLLGREVARLADGRFAAGTHRATFDAARRASGVYYARLEAGGMTILRSMLLVR